MYYIVYLITNNVNQKIYVGKHSTENLDDNYLGKGKLITQAIRKYGKSNFKRTILFYCLTEQDAFEIEASIVDRDFIQRDDTYNLVPGGIGCPVYTNKGIGRSIETKEKIRQTLLKHERYANCNKIKKPKAPKNVKGSSLTTEQRMKISETMKRKHQELKELRQLDPELDQFYIDKYKTLSELGVIARLG